LLRLSCKHAGHTLSMSPNTTKTQLFALADSALALRRSHPNVPPSEILALVLQDRCVCFDYFYETTAPPDPFAMLIAEAVGEGGRVAEWVRLSQPGIHPSVQAQQVLEFRRVVWPVFARRYGQSLSLLLGWEGMLDRGDDFGFPPRLPGYFRVGLIR
jgi:hypothetical protein